MAKTLSDLSPDDIAQLIEFGTLVKAFRREHGINQSILAETLGMDRRTLSKLEKGDPSISMGTAIRVWRSLGFSCELRSPTEQEAYAQEFETNYLPMKIALADYPVLRRCSWQLQESDSISPRMAFRLYQDKKSDLDKSVMSRKEQNLIGSLEQVYGLL